MITPTETQKADWKKMADAAYSSKLYDTSTRFRKAAQADTMTMDRFTRLQADLARWQRFCQFPDDVEA